MKLKAVSGIMLILLLVVMLTTIFNVSIVRAEIETIYIKADGSIEPSTANITSVDNVTYTFTGNIFNYSIIIERDNIVVDGAGCTLQGTRAYESKGIELTGRSNVTIKNMEIRAFEYGIYLYESSNSTIFGNNVANNGVGIWFSGSSNHNSISGNNATANYYGVFLSISSDYNSISGNNITANTYYGIWFSGSSNNSISGNSLIANNIGIKLISSSNNSISGNNLTANGEDGIWLSASSSNAVSGNNVANNGEGIFLGNSHSNNISRNNITNNNVGINLDSSSNNIIYHNNFVDNAQQVISYDSTNIWDAGYPSGGNYWGDHTCTDFHSGTLQNQKGSDGIGDTPYVIDENNTDRYPLIPWLWGDINDDGKISLADVGKMDLIYRLIITEPAWMIKRADLNGNSKIDLGDLEKLKLIYSGYL